MSDLEKLAADYFSPPAHHFWRWADNGETAEWKNGETICYTADLLNVLRGLEDIGLPPLGTVLILLAACQAKEDDSNLEAYIQKMAEVIQTQYGRAFRVNPMARTMLELIKTLPADLRTGPARIHLIREVLDNDGTRNRANRVPPENVRAVLDTFASGRIDHQTFKKSSPEGRYYLLIEILPLAFACRKFPDAATLEHYLRSGVSEPPQPADLPLPEPAQLDLLDELDNDPKTQGLARLARRLLAALNIPMHARGASDLPIGGVADISNRGDFDRLLLSELAYDDHTLTARLVNNEALFLRREEPPVNLDRRRIILMDTTLKMWGVQRVFALSAALAVARNSHHVVGVQAYGLGGHEAEEIDLSSKTGILSAMGQLDSALHCGEALTHFFSKTPKSEQEDYVLISDADAMRGEAFQAALAAVRERLRFLLVLHRDGSLEFYEYAGGRGKQIGKPKFDLETLLFAPPESKTPAGDVDGAMPAFYRQSPRPLYFPLTAAKLNRSNTYFDPDHGALIVTQHHRLLHWRKDGAGAFELLPYIESGAYCFGFGPDGEIFALVHQPEQKCLRFYRFDGAGNTVKIDFKTGFSQVSGLAFHQNVFYIKTPAGIRAIDAPAGILTSPGDETGSVFKFYQVRLIRINFSDLRQLIRHNYSVIQRVKEISFTTAGEPAVDGHFLRVVDRDHMKWTPGGGAEVGKVEVRHLPENPMTLLGERCWPDGRRAIADSRGFLHLIPAGNRPQVTILLVADTMTAAWASDGATCGNMQFVREPAVKHLPVAEFFEKYIQPFAKAAEDKNIDYPYDLLRPRIPYSAGFLIDDIILP